MKILNFLVILLVLCIAIPKVHTGPLAPGVWSGICASCTYLAWYPPAMITCCLALGPALSILTCFDESTKVFSENGEVLIGDLEIGDKVLTKNG
jgi:hypothetical protein